MMPGQQNTKTTASQQFGQAQPQQPQPQGTPYNPQQGGNFSGYGPQQGFSGYGPQQGGGFSAWNPNIANNAQAPRPPAFQAAYGQMGGGYSDQPNTPQRDAFISQVNNQLGQMQGQSWQQPTGAPQFNFGQMMGQANQMVDQGFQNPFAMQPNRPSPSAAPRYAPGTSQGYMEQFPDTGRPPPPQDNAAAIRNLLQGFNIPPNVMEQISGLFGGQQPSPQPQQGSAPGPARPAQDPYESSRPAGPQRLLIDQRRSRQQPQQRASPGSGKNPGAAAQADPFEDSVKYGTYKPSDVDELGLPDKEAQALKERARQIANKWEMVRKAAEIQYAFGGKGGGMSKAAYDKKMREFGASPAAAGLYSPLKK